MKKKIYQYTIELTNGPFTSSLLQRFAKSSGSRSIIPNYIKTYKIDTQDIEDEISSFTTLHDFFIRKLRPESRPQAPTDIISPVDGKVEIAGNLHADSRFLVKGQEYSLAELLGSDKLAERYSNGKYAVLYLSPADYHRIHSPADGKILRQFVLGKKSYPVNQSGLLYGKAPISGNYRLISELEMEKGRMLMVKVGAMFVNSIELTNTDDTWKKGEEVGYFSFGSTVVLFFEPDCCRFSDNIVAGEPIKVGEALANML
ncbi:phosphatidylserine decarboxylase [Planococcus beigongshangi]|uniref:phosphatidylserine decarboxylase n=1 Tax=Planococcus beigongshangi TaxID=2782536 RepID=UPI00193B8EFC|nr:phosphatidylserine decarboxylase [Planococcus beigongshangi]